MRTWKRLLNRVVYNDDPDLILSPAKKNMDRFIMQAMLGTAFGTFSGGIFLSGYLLYLGAPDSVTSYVPLLPNICGIFLLFVSTLVDRRETRKKFLLTVNATCKTLLISVAFVPLFVPEPFRIPVIFVFLICGQAIACVNNIAFNSWFNELIPVEIKGRFFSTRQIFCVLMTMILPVAAGFFVDRMENRYLAFVILFLCAGLTGGMELLVFGKLDDVKLEASKEKVNIVKAFVTPLKNKPFFRYVIVTCLLHFFVHISASFSQIFLLRYLNSSYTYINAMAIINCALQMLIFYKFWGKVTDRLGANFTLTVSLSLYALDYLSWVFVNERTLVFIYPLIQIFAALEGPAFTVGLYTRRYELIPKEGRSMYDSFFVCCLGVTLLAAPFVGNLLRDLFSRVEVLEHISFGSFRAVYLVSAVSVLVLGMLALRSAKKQDETGTLYTKESWRQMKRMFAETIGIRR